MADEETHRLNQETEHLEDPYAEPVESKPLHTRSRQGFIRKVYSILASQLVLTSIFMIAAISNQGLGDFMRRNIPVLIVTCIISIVTLYALACYPTVARRVPVNYILLFIFTFAESYLVYILGVYSEPPSPRGTAHPTLLWQHYSPQSWLSA